VSAVHHHTLDGSSPSIQLGALAPRLFRLGMGVGIAGLGLGVLLYFTGISGVDAKGFFKSWLTGFLYVLSISLGALFFTLIQHAVRAGWSVTLRRLAEGVAANLMWVWVLFLPIFVLVLVGQGGVLYPWLNPHYVATDEIIQGKTGYLNQPFFLIRAALFIGIWVFLARFFWTNSVAQDATGDVRFTHRMQRLAPVGLMLFGLTLTFAAVDWAMSLEPHWFSTIFGVYFFAMCCCGFFASLAIIVWFLHRQKLMLNEVTSEHAQDIGKLLFGFGVVFHAYIGFSQFMLIWYANIPETTGWYIARTTGGWQYFIWALPILHFAVPFLLIISKHAKRNRLFLAGVAGLLLAMHYVDIYLLVMPYIKGSDLLAATSYPALIAAIDAGEVSVSFSVPTLLDLSLWIGMLGLMVGMTARRLGTAPLVPVGDPRLDEALAFENM